MVSFRGFMVLVFPREVATKNPQNKSTAKTENQTAKSAIALREGVPLIQTLRRTHRKPMGPSSKPGPWKLQSTKEERHNRAGATGMRLFWHLFWGQSQITLVMRVSCHCDPGFHFVEWIRLNYCRETFHNSLGEEVGKKDITDLEIRRINATV